MGSVKRKIRTSHCSVKTNKWKYNMDTISGTYIQDLELALTSIANSSDPNHKEAAEEYQKVIQYLKAEKEDPEINIEFDFEGDWL